jgi:hypothetical protein
LTIEVKSDPPACCSSFEFRDEFFNESMMRIIRQLSGPHKVVKFMHAVVIGSGRFVVQEDFWHPHLTSDKGVVLHERKFNAPSLCFLP